MTESKTKSVRMTYQALYSYILNTYYRSLSGVLGILISIAALAVLFTQWEKLAVNRKVLYFLVASAFTVVNPLMLAFKAFRQFKLSPSYREPLDYTFADQGITISQGEISEELPWSGICRILLTGKILVVYTSRLHAFVLPLSELGKDRGKIIAAVVQFTAEYKPKISRNLQRFQSGKGL